MSLPIDTDDVREVLLSDGWHQVAPRSVSGKWRSSFTLDAYEYIEDGELNYSGGYDQVLSSTGFSFTELTNSRTGKQYGVRGATEVCGPITAILAVKRDPK